MTEEEQYTQEEYENMLRQQARLQGIAAPEMANSEMIDYLETLAEDHSFSVDDKTGKITGGTVPFENKLLYWATNSKNMKWGNLKKGMDKRIRLTNLQISMTNRMYELNPKLIRENPDLGEWALRTKNSIINNINQRNQTEVNISRGTDGFERKQVGTATGQFVSENPQAQKQGIVSRVLGGLTGR